MLVKSQKMRQDVVFLPDFPKGGTLLYLLSTFPTGSQTKFLLQLPKKSWVARQSAWS
ncbi:hypothetical protein NIES4071_103990 (plasmid) [Calothrix sp. NIES-4071]|nr:hypothetical protein NIES4071_103990 [Calothrix sp. NIES-4071]BAZ64386.1 hypothetical protein NIES4105_101190 [Calothrix sp. NIES-4105]